MIYSLRNILRLWRNKRSIVRFSCNSATNESENNGNNNKHNKQKDFKTLLQQNKHKIQFNTYLEHEKLDLGYIKYYLKTIKRAKLIEQNTFKEKSLPPLPVSLQYYVNKDRLINEDTVETKETPKIFQLPFANASSVPLEHSNCTEPHSQPKQETEFDRSNLDKWMTNYEHFDDTRLTENDDDIAEESLDSEWCKQYGTSDPSIRISQVPCGGCGALLHCTDSAIPGYLPSELFKGRKEEELKVMECQRCHFLKEYNIALDISVQPEEYEKLIQSIRHIKSLVLLMVDLLDFPCSIWPGIVDIIGTDRPLIIVANKVDLLPGDSIGYLQRVRESLMAEINRTKLRDANIKYVALISAKTGYGVENLISSMFKIWLYKGDVFLIGTTNVGKSSLFNALLQSDYCQVHATDIVQRATVSRWPGTTLNLLKFPINRPSGWKIKERSQRLRSEGKLIKVEKEIRKGHVHGKDFSEAPSLISHIGRTFADYEVLSDNIAENKHKMTIFNEKHELFKNSKWCYDTPGVIHPDQVISLLSTEELVLTIPKKLLRPQTYYLREGSSFFIGGLARIDIVGSQEPCRVTIFCSEHLPITVTKTENADDVYDKFLGTELFAVPSGETERLENWPGLERKEKNLEFIGEGPKLCCGDVVLSSIAWVSVTAKKDTVCQLAAWTPEARGIHKRYPSVLPYSINLKGKRIHNTPTYTMGKVFVGKEL